jgi:asparagine synthase (glutamine-hydrolysing)
VLERLATLRRVPGWLGRVSAMGISALAPRRLDPPILAAFVPAAARTSTVRKINRLGGMLADPTAARLLDLHVSYWQPDEIAALIGSHHVTRPAANSYPGTPADQISLWDFHHYLPEDILTKVDRMTMAVSIEGREPLLDHRLAEFAFRLPLHLRRGGLGPKHLLKRVLYRHVPRFLVDRPKRGFGIPLDRWLRTDLRLLVDEYLAEQRIRDAGVMDWRTVRKLLASFDRGASDLAAPLWFVLAFEMWREQWG